MFVWFDLREKVQSKGVILVIVPHFFARQLMFKMLTGRLMNNTINALDFSNFNHYNLLLCISQCLISIILIYIMVLHIVHMRVLFLYLNKCSLPICVCSQFISHRQPLYCIYFLNFVLDD